MSEQGQQRASEQGAQVETAGPVLEARALSAAFPTIGDQSARYAPHGLPGDPPWPGDLPSGCPFHLRCPDVVDLCRTEDVALRSAGPQGHRAACVHVGSAVQERRA